jgi:hypothetical protein
MASPGYYLPASLNGPHVHLWQVLQKLTVLNNIILRANKKAIRVLVGSYQKHIPLPHSLDYYLTSYNGSLND